MLDKDKAWSDYREKFSEIYDGSNYSSRLQAYVMQASHRLVEKAFTNKLHFDRVLEVGAGTGEHLQFVRHAFDEYILTDIDPKTLEVAKRKLAGSRNCKVGFEAQAGNNLAFPDNAFDRVIAAHVLALQVGAEDVHRQTLGGCEQMIVAG